MGKEGCGMVPEQGNIQRKEGCGMVPEQGNIQRKEGCGAAPEQEKEPWGKKAAARRWGGRTVWREKSALR
jgi:hypothetical protein